MDIGARYMFRMVTVTVCLATLFAEIRGPVTAGSIEQEIRM